MGATSAKPFQTAAKYGALTGVVLILFSVILYAIGLKGDNKITYLNYVFLLGGIIIGTKEYRDKVREGDLSYGQGLGLGVLVSVFAGLMLAFYTYIFMKFISPEIIQEMLLMAEQQLVEQGKTESEIEMALKYTAMFMTPGIISIMLVVMHLFFGFIFSLITAAVFRKEPTNQSFDEVINNT